MTTTLEWNLTHPFIILNRGVFLSVSELRRPSKKSLYKPNQDTRTVPAVPPMDSCSDSCVAVPPAQGTGQAGGRQVQGGQLAELRVASLSMTPTHGTCRADWAIPSEQQHLKAKSSTALSSSWCYGASPVVIHRGGRVILQTQLAYPHPYTLVCLPPLPWPPNSRGKN